MIAVRWGGGSAAGPGATVPRDGAGAGARDQTSSASIPGNWSSVVR
jgi:hypothetical protein